MPNVTEFQKTTRTTGNLVRARVLVTGYVQGVGFRWFIHKKAEECGATGWIHNLDDGRLEAVFEGSREQVDTMISHSRSGPESAKVNNIQIFWEEPENKWDELEITY